MEIAKRYIEILALLTVVSSKKSGSQYTFKFLKALTKTYDDEMMMMMMYFGRESCSSSFSFFCALFIHPCIFIHPWVGDTIDIWFICIGQTYSYCSTYTI